MPNRQDSDDLSTRLDEIDELSDALAEPSDEGLSLDQPPIAETATAGDLPYETASSEASDDLYDPDTCCPISPATIVEAILFVGDPDNRPVSARHIASLMRGVRSSEVDLVVKDLNETYEEQGCPYRIETSAAGYRLALLDEHAALCENFYGRVREAKLSQAAIEALATIAYSQPVTRDELKTKCTDVQRRAVAQLVRRGLVSAEKQPLKDGGMLYRTTDRFLHTFGLSNLEDLPQPHDLEQH